MEEEGLGRDGVKEIGRTDKEGEIPCIVEGKEIEMKRQKVM
jgi:hypothetical protein